MGKQSFDALAVVLGRMDAGAIGGAVDDGTGEPATGTVSHPRRLADDLLHAGEDEALELEFGHGLEPLGRHADRHPGDQPLRQRRVYHPLEAELVAQPHCGTEHTAVDTHILTQHHHVGVVLHLVMQRQIDRFEQRYFTHAASPDPEPSRDAMSGESLRAVSCHSWCVSPPRCCMPLAMMR